MSINNPRNPLLNAASSSESLPIGSVIMWVGTLETIPTGWHLCDGEDGTIDLRGMFALGAGGTYNLGDTGGEETHTLTQEEMPAHNHILPGVGNTIGHPVTYTDNGVYGPGKQNEQPLTNARGGSKPHNNMPPYKALYYIQKIA